MYQNVFHVWASVSAGQTSPDPASLDPSQEVFLFKNKVNCLSPAYPWTLFCSFKFFSSSLIVLSHFSHCLNVTCVFGYFHTDLHYEILVLRNIKTVIVLESFQIFVSACVILFLTICHFLNRNRNSLHVIVIMFVWFNKTCTGCNRH